MGRTRQVGFGASLGMEREERELWGKQCGYWLWYMQPVNGRLLGHMLTDSGRKANED